MQCREIEELLYLHRDGELEQKVSREPVREQKKEPEQPPAPEQNQKPKTKPESKHTRRPKLKPGLKELERFFPGWITVRSLRIALAILIGILAASFIA